MERVWEPMWPSRGAGPGWRENWRQKKWVRVGGEAEVWETLGDGISRQGRWGRVEDQGPYMGPQRQYLVGQRAQGHIDWGALRRPGSVHTGPAFWACWRENISGVKALSSLPGTAGLGGQGEPEAPQTGLPAAPGPGVGAETLGTPGLQGCSQGPSLGCGPWAK